MDYSIFPYWMGISNFGEFICAIIAVLLLFFIYLIFGYAFCPNSIENHFARAMYILFWPIMIVIMIIIFPFVMLYEFSKPVEVQDKELKEFIKENY